MISQPNATGYHWAQQCYFRSGQGGYIGLQPRTDSGLAVFSTSGSGSGGSLSADSWQMHRTTA